MRISTTAIFSAAILCLISAGCQNKVDDENHRLWQQNRDLQAALDAQRQQPAPAPMVMQPTTAPAPAPRVADVPPPIKAPEPAPSIQGVDTSYNPSAGTMTVNLLSDVTFDPGQAMIRSGAKQTLDRIAAALKKEYAGKQVRIEGHTDSDPIKVSKWKDNLALSEARADAVKKYLVDKGVDDSVVRTKGFGDTHPKGADKAANRRVEIVVVVNSAGGPGSGGASTPSMNK